LASFPAFANLRFFAAGLFLAVLDPPDFDVSLSGLQSSEYLFQLFICDWEIYSALLGYLNELELDLGCKLWTCEFEVCEALSGLGGKYSPKHGLFLSFQTLLNLNFLLLLS